MDLTTVITVLFLLLARFDQLSAQDTKNPRCTPKISIPQKKTIFVIYIDRNEHQEIVDRVLYMVKGMSCQIPLSDDAVTLIVGRAGTDSMTISEKLSSDEIADEIFGDITTEEGDSDENRCRRFKQSMELAKENIGDSNWKVEFIVPIIDADPDCNMLTMFQQVFGKSPNKANLAFNGILMNSTETEDNKQSVRVSIPDLAEIDLAQKDFTSSAAIGSVLGKATAAQEINNMIAKILRGKYNRDWEEGWTPLSSTVEPTTLTILQNISTSTGYENTTVTTSQPYTTMENTTAKLTTSTSHSTSTVELTTETQNTTTENWTTETGTTTTQTTTTNASVIVEGPIAPIPQKPHFNRTPLNGGKAKAGPSPNGTTTKTTTEGTTEGTTTTEQTGLKMGEKMELVNGTVSASTTRSTAGSFMDDLWIYIILLVLLIVLFLVVMCYCCCCGKKNKEDQDEKKLVGESKPLVRKKKPETSKSKSKSASGSGSVESDDAMKNIKPGSYKVVDEEAGPTPNKPASYDPVEVSDYESKEANDQYSERPRHGYQPSKPPAAFHFE